MKPWHMRYARGIIYGAGGTAIIIVGIVCFADSPDPGTRLVEARQLYGLWALGLLLASLLIGPLTTVLPWLPLRPTLMYARRAVGLMALTFAIPHVGAYIWSVLRRDWHEFYTPGPLWWAGLVLGIIVFFDLIALGLTSRDASVRSMGGRKWKHLHQTLYVALVLCLIHSLFVGADFGLNHAPDVKSEADFGSLIAFVAISVVWLLLFLFRRAGWTWHLPFSFQRRRIAKKGL